ncbi:MAG: serine hydrolase [Ignavibacteriae bacterium]|nr:MAG: serine hydrolase [Ignavibacteriota bacterium]
MKYLIKFSIYIFFAIFITGINAQDKSQKIDEYLNKCFEKELFNGSVLVSNNTGVMLKKGYGYANLEWNIPNEADTKFRLGSITKQFTAMLILQLVEKGQVKLDGKISDYLPYYPKKTGDKITIHNLLNHTSGIFNYTNDPAFFRKGSFLPMTPEQLIKTFADKELDFEPGTKWNYSNSGYIVLGAIIEQVTGKTYETMLQENIFTPLGMKNTGYDHMETVLPKRASGYERSFNGMRNTSYIDMSLPFSAGSLYSTVEDLYIWGEALYTDKLVTYETMQKMLTPYMNEYGYGIRIDKVSLEGTENFTVIGHSGGINGFNTVMVRIPESKSTIILLCNTPPMNETEIASSIINILYDKPYVEPKKSAAGFLFENIGKNGAASAIEEFKKNKNELNANEGELNSLGYTLMGTGKLEYAIEVFKLNVELFPDSWNVYDSMGEAYMKNGDKELAIVNYRKSIELNPNNDAGKEALKKLESN